MENSFIYLAVMCPCMMNCAAHLCLLQCSFAYSRVLLFLSNKRNFAKLFFSLKIAPQVSLCSTFTLDSAPRAFQAFPLFILLSLWSFTPVCAQSCIHGHGKSSSSSNTFICKLRIALGSSQRLNDDINTRLSWPGTGECSVQLWSCPAQGAAHPSSAWSWVM